MGSSRRAHLIHAGRETLGAMNPAEEEGPEGRRGSDADRDIAALGEEIVRMFGEIQATEAELGRLRSRYAALREERKESSG